MEMRPKNSLEGKDMRYMKWLVGGLFLLCIACTPAGGFKTRSVPVATESESTEPGCAYFYFLWGKSAENDRRYEEALQAYEKVLVCDPESDYVIRDIALLLIKLDRKKEAIDWLNNIVGRNPNDIGNRLLLAKLYAGMADFEKAIATYNEILKINEDQKTLLMLGSLYAQIKQYDKAREYLERLLALNPDSYMGNYYLARLYRELRMFDNALVSYEKTLAISWSSRLAYEVAELYEQQGRFEEAAALYRRIVEEDESDETARSRLVNVFLQMDKVDLALEQLQEMKAVASDPEMVDITIGRLLIAKKRYDEAITLLESIIADDPEQNGARYLLALAYNQKGEVRKSTELLKSIPATAEVYEDAILLLTRITRSENDINGAIRILEKALADEQPGKMSFYIVLASLYRENHQEEKGRKIFDQAVALFPDSDELLFEYGLFLEQSGDQAGALEKMQQVLKLDPGNAAALNYVGYTWADKGINLEQALKYIEQAVALKPEDGFIRDSLGWVYFRMGEIDRAIKELERAVELVDDDAVIHEHLGDVYQQAGKSTQARMHYEKALSFQKDEEKKEELRRKIEKLKE
jgi:tetratricopeptide (TPR) repeat protein